MKVAIRGGRVIDPANHLDWVQDLFLADGHIAALGKAPAGFVPEREIGAEGRVVCPGFVDLSARLREPGQEHKATIKSETRAAAKSGITTLCCPPDTNPVIDTPAVAELIHQRGSQAGMARVEVIGALTQGLQGEHLAEMGILGEAGCVGVGNADNAIINTEVMRRAMEYAATFGLIVFVHPQDPWLAHGRHIHDGVVSACLGLPGLPETAETIEVARDLLLAEQTGARLHFCHLSTARAVDMLGEAQQRGLPVTADVTAHHLHLTEMDTADFNSQCHVLPPLRTPKDRQRLRAGLTEGIVAAVCSDHQPHERDARLRPFCATEPGISALETLLPLTLQLVQEGLMGLSQAVACLTCHPAAILGLQRGTLTVGAPGDVCIFDPEARWVLKEEGMVSRGHNTPFLGWELRGRVTHTFLAGKVVYELAEPAAR